MAVLAICGGKKTVAGALGKPWPERGDAEVEGLRDVVESGAWWRGGHSEKRPSKVFQFEDAWAKYQDAKHCVAVTNGTQALECALKAAGIVHGDEVLVPA